MSTTGRINRRPVHCISTKRRRSKILTCWRRARAPRTTTCHFLMRPTHPTTSGTVRLKQRSDLIKTTWPESRRRPRADGTQKFPLIVWLLDQPPNSKQHLINIVYRNKAFLNLQKLSMSGAISNPLLLNSSSLIRCSRVRWRGTRRPRHRFSRHWPHPTQRRRILCRRRRQCYSHRVISNFGPFQTRWASTLTLHVVHSS